MQCRLKRVLILILALCLPLGLQGLDPGKGLGHYLHDGWNLEDGLPQNSIQSILQTGDGHIWLATQEGLVRFNGKTFRHFDHYNTPRIGKNFISVLLEDRNSVLWGGTGGGGLFYLREGVFNRLDISHGLISNNIGSLALHPDGSLWVGTRGKGIDIIENGEIRHLELPANLPSYDILAIHHDRQGVTWIGTNGSGLLRYDGTRFTCFGQPEGLLSSQVSSILEDSLGKLWVGTNSTGLFLYKNGAFDSVDMFRRPASSAGTVNINVIYEDSHGIIWVGTQGLGMFRYREGRFSAYTTKDGLSHDVIFSILEDREGSLWIGTDGGGISLLKDRKFMMLDRRSGLPNDMVFPIVESPGGTLYVGTEGAGVLVLQDGVLTTINSKSHGLSDDKVFSLHLDRSGGLWIGTYGGGVNYLKNNTRKNYNTANGLSSDFIWSITEDSYGNVWVGTDGGGVNRIDPDDVITVFDTNNGLSGDRITFIFEDSAKNLYVCTNSGGINRFNDGKITVIDKNNGLSGDQIFCMYEDHSGTIWIGTDSGGLNRLKDNNFSFVTKSDGLFDNTVFNVLEDGNGDFWMSCNRGISRVSKKDLNDFCDGKIPSVRSVVYGIADGMNSFECNGSCQPTACKTRDGHLLFATIEGIVEIVPEDIRGSKTPPPVVIEEVRVDLKPVNHRLPIKLEPGANNIEIKYAGLSFIAPKQVQYKYILEGFEDLWVDAGNRTEAYFTNLPHGSYRFRVMAANKEGVWNTKGVTLPIVLKPYYYQTWWFYILFITAVLASIFLVFWYRMQQFNSKQQELAKLVDIRTEELKAANQEQEQLLSGLKKATQLARLEREAADAANRAKSEFLARMSHEIRTPMNSVIGFTEMLLDTLLDDEQSDYVRTIHHSGETLLTLIDDILDFSRMEAGRISLEPVEFDPESLAKDICRLMKPRVGNGDIKIFCTIHSSVPDYVVQDAGRVRQVLMNLVGNAVKFTKTGEIEIAMTVDDTWEDRLQLHTTVRDTGIGIEKEKLDSIFETFQQADGSVTRKYGGSGLGLAICRQIAMHMGGDIRAESQPGKGSVFHFIAWVGASDKKREQIPIPGQELVRHKSAKPAQATGDQPVCILLAEDNSVNRKLVTKMLSKAGYRVETVVDGKEAVTRFASDPNAFDLVFMDIQMPEMDGREATRELRKRGFNRVPIVAMTAETMKGDEEKCIAAGMDDYVAKPIKQDIVLGMVKKWVLDKNTGQ